MTLMSKGIAAVTTRMQYRQDLHDAVFHSDIYTLSKPRRLTHLVLHHCKYVSQLYLMIHDEAYGELINKGPTRACIDKLSVDGVIICLSMANVANKDIQSLLDVIPRSNQDSTELLLRHVGLMAKTVEDIDHMGQTNPLSQIMDSAAVMMVCYMNLWMENQKVVSKSTMFDLFRAVEERLLDVEAKNIYFTKHLVELQRRMMVYDNPISEIERVVRTVTGLMLASHPSNEVATARDINNGHCEDFAQAVCQRVQGAEMYGVEEFQTPAGKFDWGLLAQPQWAVYHPAGHTREDIDKLDLGGHLWIVHERKHYDAECPEGVSSFFDLPFFQRQMKEKRDERHPGSL